MSSIPTEQSETPVKGGVDYRTGTPSPVPKGTLQPGRLLDEIKKNYYPILNAFQDLCGLDLHGATEQQT